MPRRSQEAKPHGSQIPFCTNLVLGEMPAVAESVPGRAHVPGHLVGLVAAHGHGVAESHGCCPSMAATAGRLYCIL